MKVALADLRYIQVEIQKILNVYKGNSNNRGAQLENRYRDYMRDTTSRQNKVERNYQSPTKQRNRIASQMDTISEERKKKREKIDVKVNNQSDTKRRSKSKKRIKQVQKKIIVTQPKQQGLQSLKNRYEEAMNKSTINGNQREEGKSANIKTIGDRSVTPQVYIQEQKEENGAKSWIKRWSALQTKDQGSLQNNKYLFPAKSISQTKRLQQSQLREQESILQNEKKSIKKQKHSASKVQASSSLCKSTKRKVDPYYLNKTNKTHLRSNEYFLTQKNAAKSYQTNEKKEKQLKMKYHVLDQRLDKLRNDVYTSKKRDVEMDEGQKLKKQKDKYYTKQLQKYYRYSPLKKLLTYRQSISGQTSRRHSLSLYMKNSCIGFSSGNCLSSVN